MKTFTWRWQVLCGVVLVVPLACQGGRFSLGHGDDGGHGDQIGLGGGGSAGGATSGGGIGGTAGRAGTADGASMVRPVDLSAGLYSTCVLFSNRAIACWGYNEYGQLGDGTTKNSAAPVMVQGLIDAVSISASSGYHACAVLSNGKAQCWGSNSYGPLGDNTMVNSSTIKTVQNLNDVSTVSTGANCTCAAKTDGTAYGWGQFPDGRITSTPIAIPGLTGVKSLTVGSNHICALLADETVACWGANDEGQLGTGVAGPDRVTTPTVIPGLSQVTAIASGTGDECALLRDGTLRCWGANTKGQLGNGTVNASPPLGSATPGPVSGLSGVTAIALGGNYACALLADGTVNCWGDNQYGTLGNGTTTNSSTPVPVSGLTGVSAISAGIEHACALFASGSIACWGLDTQGELGPAPVKDPCAGEPACSTTPLVVP